VRALYMAFAMNAGAFHLAGGEGYRLIADLILALDPINAQTRRACAFAGALAADRTRTLRMMRASSSGSRRALAVT